MVHPLDNTGTEVHWISDQTRASSPRRTHYVVFWKRRLINSYWITLNHGASPYPEYKRISMVLPSTVDAWKYGCLAIDG